MSLKTCEGVSLFVMVSGRNVAAADDGDSNGSS